MALTPTTSKTVEMIPQPLFKNNDQLLKEKDLQTFGATFTTMVYMHDKHTKISQQTSNPNLVDFINQYSNKIATLTDLITGMNQYVDNEAPYFNVILPPNYQDLKNEYLATINQYYNNIANIKFDNCNDMVLQGEAFDMGTLNNYCVNDIDKGGQVYLQFSHDTKVVKYAFSFYNTGSFRRNTQISNVKFNICTKYSFSMSKK